MEETGFCPNCGAKGRTGEPCAEKVCQRHGYHLIPESNYQKVEVVHADPTDPLIGRMIGEYLVVDHVGTGGFGAVYLALQTPIMMKSALKLMGRRRTDTPAEDDLAEKFKREAAALATLTHPNVVRLLKFGVHAGRPYIVMEYVEGGRTLKEEINNIVAEGSRMDPEAIPHIFRQILNALDAAHSKQIVHRDIKPDNVMLQEVHGDPSFVKVLDFGLAKFTEERTDTSILVGTPVYMAPEQITRKGIGPWTDLYAVGVMLFELVTGRRTYARSKERNAGAEESSNGDENKVQAADSTGIPAFVVDSLEEELRIEKEQEEPFEMAPQRGGNTTQEILLNKLDPDFDPMARVADLDLPQVAMDFFRKALAKEPGDRFQSAAEFRAGMDLMFMEIDRDKGPAPPMGRISGLLDSTEIMRVKLERERLEEERLALAKEKKEFSRTLEEAPTLVDRHHGGRGKFGTRWLIVSTFVVLAAGAIIGLYYALQSAEEIIQRLSGKGNGVKVEAVEEPDKAPGPPRLGPAPGAERELLLNIDRKLADGEASEAESLLARCLGEECNSRWNSLAVVYESRKDADSAVRVYRHLYDVEKNEGEKQRIAERIKVLGQKLD